MSESNVATRIEQAIRDYIQACNDGDAERVAACFVSDAVHYFPTVAKWSGASTIGAISRNACRRKVTCGQSIKLSTRIGKLACLSGPSSIRRAEFFAG